MWGFKSSHPSQESIHFKEENMHRKRHLSLILRIFFYILLLSIIFYQQIRFNKISNKLSKIHIFTATADSIKISNLIENKNIPKILLSNDFIAKTFQLHSPFNDSLSFKELLKKYIHSKHQDLYGAPRSTGEYKRIHEGIDFFVPENTPLYPLSNFGIVTEVEDNANFLMDVRAIDKSGNPVTIQVSYGKIVKIAYPEGFSSIYAHLNKIYVKTGDIVNQNTKIGLSGYTGNIRFSGKPSHLHMELRDKDNQSFDPKNLILLKKVDPNFFFNKIIFK